MDSQKVRKRDGKIPPLEESKPAKLNMSIRKLEDEKKTIDCQGEGCGREAYEEDEDYYSCGRCGWAGSSNNPVVILKERVAELTSYLRRSDERIAELTSHLRLCDMGVAELTSKLRDCHDLLNDCGYYFVNGIWTDPQDDNEDETTNEPN